MELNDETIKNIDTILKNEIGMSCLELAFLLPNQQQEVINNRYNPNKTIKHFKLGEKVILDDGTYTMAGMHKILDRKKMNQEFEEIFAKKLVKEK